MTEIKQYLDYPGLEEYDYRLKNWIKQLNLAQSQELEEAINNLEIQVGEGVVEERIAAAIANLVDSAPQTFDTLKEIADWIEEHGEAAAALIESVATLGQELERVEDKVDSNWNAIQSIPGAYIEALFLEPIEYDSSKTMTEQIAALGDNEKLVINAAEDAVISEDITINSDCVIEAEGVEFSGNIAVAEGTAATVIGATFSGTVTIQ